ncbi:MAP7 domain-containing protein 1-like isoform X4 [Varroa destructor]|nr:MAP7 domain-containing protein 1-like isoform X4 [Varroa destructor]XP_022654113.1 MAP7 domain-containing protein 1-like isoform X4 [Varroa destructor]XP_022654114.1 MAP7 domain-containing protein 1-like isoform X4 [Varroa destructor]XP_022654115.1 MAP7 domain-containing protein 1-like isoform X4 [Varroa destructor]
MAYNRRRQPPPRDTYWFAGASPHSSYEGLWSHQFSPGGRETHGGGIVSGAPRGRSVLSGGPPAPLSLPRPASDCSDLAESVDSYSIGAPSTVSSVKSSKRSYWFAQSGSDVMDCLRHPSSAETGHPSSVNQLLTAAVATQAPQQGHQQQLLQQQHGVSANAGLMHQTLQPHHSTQVHSSSSSLQIGQQQHHTAQSPTSALNSWNSGGTQANTDLHQAERLRVEARERQEMLHRRRMEELAAHNENAQRIREEGDTDRRRHNQERQVLTEIHRQQVDERRRALHEADQEWREAVLRRSQERDLRAEQYRRNRLSASILLEGIQAQPASVMSSPARGASEWSPTVHTCHSDRLDELQVQMLQHSDLHNGHLESPEDSEDKVAPLPTNMSVRMTRSPRMASSCYGNLWGSGALVQEDGDLMSRSMIVTSSAARRKTDLTPVTPSPWARGLGAGSKALTPSRPQTAAGSAGTPKRAVSMSRLDILAQPRRRFTMEDLKSRSHSAWKLNDPSQSGQAGQANGLKGMKGARSMSHLSSTPHPPRLTRTSQMRASAQQYQSQMQSSNKGHQSTSSSRSEQVSPTHQLSAPHHLRSRSQMSSDLSQSSVASSVGSPHANMRPKAQGSANRKARPLSIAGSIPSSELDKKDKGQPLMKPHKPVPPASSPEPQAVARQRRSASPKKKEQVPLTREVLDDTLTSEEMAVPVCSAVPVDIPLLMTQSFTEGCMPIENRPAEVRKTKTREEAMAEIAEARRKAREELEKQAEEERRKKEEEAAARRAIQEKRRQLEEEARLKREKEEEEKRRQEEDERKAEEERVRQEEEAKRILEEKAKQEAFKRQKKEEQERLERKKRVEEIMARTRKARSAGGNKESGDSNGQQGEATGTVDSNESSTNVSPVRELNGSAPAGKAELQSNNGSSVVGNSDGVNEKGSVTSSQTRNGLLNGHGANNGAGQEKPVAQEQVMIAPAGGNNPNVIEKKEKEPVSIDNSANGPASTDSGTGSADFNSNSTQAVIQPEHPASGGNNNVQHVQANTPPVLPGQATTADAPLIVQGPLIQDLLS